MKKLLLTIMLLMCSSVAAQDTIFYSDFEFHCGFNSPAVRQTSGVVYFGVFPIPFNQPLLKWGDLWGFDSTCPRNLAGTCVDVLDFPQILGSQPILIADTHRYVSLPFTLEGALAIGMTSGRFKPSTSGGSPGTALTMSISDRCGDFASKEGFLLSHPKCIQTVINKHTFGWTTTPSVNACSLGTNPSKQWWVSIRVDQCEDLQPPLIPTTCLLNILHQ